jgi:hypothetical protein
VIRDIYAKLNERDAQGKAKLSIRRIAEKYLQPNYARSERVGGKTYLHLQYVQREGRQATTAPSALDPRTTRRSLAFVFLLDGLQRVPWIDGRLAGVEPVQTHVLLDAPRRRLPVL